LGIVGVKEVAVFIAAKWLLIIEDNGGPRWTRFDLTATTQRFEENQESTFAR
jgi:hypothetical protein